MTTVDEHMKEHESLEFTMLDIEEDEIKHEAETSGEKKHKEYASVLMKFHIPTT